MQFAEHAALARIESKDTDSQDFMSYVLRHNDEKGMSQLEIIENSGVMIIAGSETTATLLSGTTYFLLKNPDKLEKLTNEIRSAFSSEEEITVTQVDQLKYMLAVFNEGFRMCKVPYHQAISTALCTDRPFRPTSCCRTVETFPSRWRVHRRLLDS
jgi:cytochrome P450